MFSLGSSMHEPPRQSVNSHQPWVMFICESSSIPLLVFKGATVACTLCGRSWVIRIRGPALPLRLPLEMCPGHVVGELPLSPRASLPSQLGLPTPLPGPLSTVALATQWDSHLHPHSESASVSPHQRHCCPLAGQVFLSAGRGPGPASKSGMLRPRPALLHLLTAGADVGGLPGPRSVRMAPHVPSTRGVFREE